MSVATRGRASLARRHPRNASYCRAGTRITSGWVSSEHGCSYTSYREATRVTTAELLRVYRERVEAV